MLSRSSFFLAVLILICSSVAFATEDTANLCAEGDALLAKGDIKGAFSVYVTASKTYPDNSEILNKAMLLKRVITLERFTATQSTSPNWDKAALQLHAFYLSHGLKEKALVNDKKLHKKLNNTLSASLMVETLLELNENKQALDQLSKVEKKDTQCDVYEAIALARLNKVKDAGNIKKDRIPAKTDTVGLLYDYARLDALLGDHRSAYTNLTAFLEAVPASQHDTLKKFVLSCQDFKALVNTEDFQKVMKTKSKVVVSDCSGGSSCATCPSRNKCGSGESAKDKPVEKKKEDACGGCEKKSEGCGGCEKSKG